MNKQSVINRQIQHTIYQSIYSTDQGTDQSINQSIPPLPPMSRLQPLEHAPEAITHEISFK